MGRLTLLRHGQTKANAAKLLQGRIDNELDPVGLSQASAAAAALGTVDRVISSPLKRAQQTAAALGQTVELDERWVELDYGDFDGLPLGDVPSQTWDQWRSDSSFRLPNGESLGELGARVRAALIDLTEADAPNQHTVVVSHMSPIKAAAAWALDVHDDVAWRMHLGTASITRIEFRMGTAVLTGFNDVSHHP